MKILTSVKFIRFCLFVCTVIPGIIFAQQSGYPVQEYLAQTTIADISIAPNGSFMAVITVQDNFEKNTTEKRLWQFEIDAKGSVISKIEIPIYKHAVSQLDWTKDSDFLVFVAKDSVSKNLFKVATNNPTVIVPVLPYEKRLKKLSSYTILDTNRIIYTEKFSPVTTKKDAIIIQLPEAKNTKHTTFKSFDFGSDAVDSLFTIKANVSYFEVSPNKEKILYTNYEPKSYFTSMAYADSHTYIIHSSTGKQIKQLTNDKVRDNSRWQTNDKVLSLYSGNPEADTYNRSFNQFYSANLKEHTKRKLTQDFKGRIRGFVQWTDERLLINGEQSTSSNLFSVEKNGEIKKISNLKGTVSNFTTNRSKNLMAFSLLSSTAFEEVYIVRSFDELKKPIKISGFNSKLSSYNCPTIETITWKNAAGNPIEGVLLWPPGKKGAKNLPFVVDIHGGPWSSRSEALSLTGVQYYYYAALLASKGFLVLQPNYSGSTGKGQDLVDAINGRPSTQPTDDILTGVQYVIDQKWADKNKMIVKGASYGGLLTNYIIGVTDMFVAALPSCGVWDESASYGTGDGDSSEFIRFNGKTVWQTPELYAKESPIYNATKIKTPTLITHGEKDVRVPTHNAYAMYYALKEMNVPTKLVILKGEGHIYKKPSSKLAKTKAELDFINTYIKFQ